MIILGLNAYHADASACLVADGRLIAATEEERFRRVKHWAGFPTEAIKYCLNEAKVTAEHLDHIAINRNPKANLLRKVLFAFAKRPSLDLVRARLENAGKVSNPIDLMAAELGIDRGSVRAKPRHEDIHPALSRVGAVRPSDV